MAKTAFSKGTYSSDPKHLEYPSLGLLLDPDLEEERASAFKIVGALVFIARADNPQKTESVWKSLHLSKTC